MSTTRPVLGFALCSLLVACGGGDDDDGGTGGTRVDAGMAADRPETTITVAPRTPSNQRPARFEFESDQPDSQFRCAIAGRQEVSCESPVEFELADGPHRLVVTAMTPSGLRDPSPAEHTWTIDTVAPITEVFQRPAPIDNSLNPRFDFYTADGDEPVFDCQLDGAAFAPCPPPYTPGPLAEGPHTVTIRATDEAGNVEALPVTFPWIVDLSPPDTTIETGPEGVRTSPDATFTFSTPDGAAGSTFLCVLDNTGWEPCTSPHAVTGLADGNHVFDVRVVEPVGTTDPTPARRMWTIDTTPPVVEIQNGPLGATSDNTPTFTFVAGAGTTSIQCRVTTATTPAPDFAPCTSPFTAAALPDGLATFEVRAADVHGNHAIANRGFTVDTSAPTVAWTATPAALGNDNTPTFTWTATGATLVRCSIDGGGLTTCGSSWTPSSSISEGAHSFTVSARDAAFNTTALTFNYTVDTVAPTLSIWSTPSLTTDTTPSFPFSAGGPAECRMDSQPFVACTSPFTAAPLADGVHDFHVRTSDPAGNVRVASRPVTIDTRPLNVTILSGPTGPTSERTPSFTWTTTGAAASLSCRYDAQPFDSCFTALETLLADGPHTFEVRVESDLPAVFSATQSFTVDTVAPGVVFTGGPSGTITTSSVTFTFDTSGGPEVTECRLYRQGQPSGAYAPCGTPHHAELAPPTTPYPFVFEVRVRDAAGNQWSAYRSFTYAP